VIDLFEESGYGRFDPSTFGLWVRVDRAIEHPRYADWGALMWETFQAPPHEGHVEYLADAPADDLPLLLSAFSLWAHESRHFFDLLATPYGAAVMRTAVHAALGYLQIVDELEYQYRGIMLPLSEWVEYGRVVHHAFGKLSKPSPGVEETVDLWRRLSGMLETFDFGRFADPANAPVSARSILEGSAVLHQERHLYTHFGLERAETFRRYVCAGEAASLYYGPALFLRQAIAGAGGSPDSSAVSYLLLATLCGDWHSNRGSEPHYPAEIYVQLIDWLGRSGAAAAVTDLESSWGVVDAFFEEERGQAPAEALARAADHNEAAAEQFHSMVAGIEENWQQESVEGRRLVELFDDYRVASASLALAVFGAPDWYFGYYDQTESALPVPLLFLESDTGVPVDDFIRENYAIVVAGNLPGPQLGIAWFEGAAGLDAVLGGEKLVSGVGGPEAARVLSPLGAGDDVRLAPIDLELWRAVHADIGAIRLFAEGPDQGVSAHMVDRAVARLGVLGTAVYTRAGELPAPLASSDAFEDPGVTERIEEIRRRKLAQEPWSDLWWAE